MSRHVRLAFLLLAAAQPALLAGPVSARTAAPADADQQRVLGALATLGARPVEQLTVEQARSQPTPADAVRKVLTDMHRPTTPPPGVTTRDITYVAAAGLQPARIYTPAGGPTPKPVVLYFTAVAG